MKKQKLIICMAFIGLYLMTGDIMAEDIQKGSEPGIVNTDAGYISGLSENGIWAYLGIPYAAPPIGDLRWRPPQPAKPWEGVLKADKFGPSCPQAVAKEFGPEWYPGNMSELYFVFRPSYWQADPTSTDVSDYVMDMWTRFAKTGNPNGGINVTWPKYSSEKDQYLDIGVTPVVKTGY